MNYQFRYKTRSSKEGKGYPTYIYQGCGYYTIYDRKFLEAQLLNYKIDVTDSLPHNVTFSFVYNISVVCGSFFTVLPRI